MANEGARIPVFGVLKESFRTTGQIWPAVAQAAVIPLVLLLAIHLGMNYIGLLESTGSLSLGAHLGLQAFAKVGRLAVLSAFAVAVHRIVLLGDKTRPSFQFQRGEVVYTFVVLGLAVAIVVFTDILSQLVRKFGGAHAGFLYWPGSEIGGWLCGLIFVPILFYLPAVAVQLPGRRFRDTLARLRPNLLQGIAIFALIFAIFLVLYAAMGWAVEHIRLLKFDALNVQAVQVLPNAWAQEALNKMLSLSPEGLRFFGLGLLDSVLRTTTYMLAIGFSAMTMSLVYSRVHREEG